MKGAGHYIEKFLQLHRDAIPGRWPRITTNEAPHKPILLITVADGYLEDRNRKNFINLSELAERRFQAYWSLIFGGRRRSTVALPFFHLKSDGFWHLVTLGAIDEDKLSKSTRKSLSALKEVVSGATLDEELHELLSHQNLAAHFRSVLITTYFGPELHSKFFNL